MDARSNRLLTLAGSLIVAGLVFQSLAFMGSSRGLSIAALAFVGAGALFTLMTILSVWLARRERVRTDSELTRWVEDMRDRPAEAPAAVSELPPARTPAAVPERQPPAEEPPHVLEPSYRVPATLDPEEVLRALLDATRSAGDPVAASLWFEDPPTATLRQVAAVGAMPPSRQPVPVTDDVLGHAALEGTSRLGPIMTVTEGGARWTLHRYAMPIPAGVATAVAAVDFRSEEPPDMRTLTRLSSVMSGALAGAVALQLAAAETRSAEELLRSLKELSRMVDPEEVVKSALHRAMRLSEAATGSVMLVGDDGNMTMAAASGIPDDILRSTVVSEGEGIAGWVMSTGKPVLIEDLPGRSTRTRRRGVRSAVSVPISDEDGVLGVMNVGSREFPARFTEAHMEALEILAGQTAVALRNARAVTSQRDLFVSTIRALAMAMESKDPYAQGETERVHRIAMAIAHAMDVDDQDRQALEIASLLHDMGMTAATDNLRCVGRPLTTVERGLIKMHPAVAAEVLKQVPTLAAVVPIVYHHHESYDGSGYVSGIAGESIPLGARILAVADAFEAMTSDRSYRKARSVTEAMNELREKAGVQFDPFIVEVFTDLLKRDPELAAR